VISKTGACAKLIGASNAAARMGSIARYLVFINFAFLDPGTFEGEAVMYACGPPTNSWHSKHTKNQSPEKTLAKVPATHSNIVGTICRIIDAHQARFCDVLTLAIF
jgi:hypothetical protein